MWSLPDIVRLNNQAAEDASQSKLQHEVEHPQEHICEVCEWDGKETPADYGYLWFDIFSDSAKGTIFLCENHDGYTGSPMEGYFTCGECNRVFIENYTWERYSTVVDCEELCLPCALNRYIFDPNNWIPLDAVQRVVLDPSDEGEDIFDSVAGTVNLSKARHLIAVKMPLPDTVVFETNLEFDSSSGEMLRSYSSTYERGVGENAALRELQELRDQGYTKVLAILDGAYQFSVSIGIYVDPTEKRAVENAQQERAQAMWKGHCQAVITEEFTAPQTPIQEAARTMVIRKLCRAPPKLVM